MASTGDNDFLRCKTCVFLTLLREEMLEHSVALFHQYAQRITTTVMSNGDVEMKEQGEVIDLESSEYLAERSQWCRNLLLPIATKILERRRAAMTPAQKICIEKWLADERLRRQIDAMEKIQAQQKAAEMERLRSEAKKRMIASEKQATKMDPTTKPQQPPKRSAKNQAKHECTKIRQADNAEECRGGTVKEGAGDKVDNGREGEKQEEEIRNEMARRLAEGGEQNTSGDQKYITAKSAKQSQVETVLLGREISAKSPHFPEDVALEQLLLQKLRLEDILEHLQTDFDELQEALEPSSKPKQQLSLQDDNLIQLKDPPDLQEPANLLTEPNDPQTTDSSSISLQIAPESKLRRDLTRHSCKIDHRDSLKRMQEELTDSLVTVPHPADRPAEDADDLPADDLSADDLLVDDLPAQNPTFPSSTFLFSICLRATQFLSKLKLWRSSTRGQSELLITKNDGHVRGSPSTIPEDPPLLNRASTRETIRQETSQDEDESFHRPSSRFGETCTQLVVKRNHLWGTGSDIRLAFLDGTPQQRKDIMRWVKIWEQSANVHFVEVDQDKSDIRISFEIGECWSYVGTKALDIPKEDPTVQLGIAPWNTSAQVQRMVLHEFGHVLGCLHEHQSPHNPLLFEKKATCEYFAAKYNWNQAQTEDDVLRMHRPEEVDATRYDSKSIMHYDFPDTILSNKVTIAENYDLSKIDQEKIGRLYPFYPSSKKVKNGPASTRKSSWIQQTNWALKSNVFGMSPTNITGTSTSEHASQWFETAERPLAFAQDTFKWQVEWLVLLCVAGGLVVGLWAVSRIGNM